LEPAVLPATASVDTDAVCVSIVAAVGSEAGAMARTRKPAQRRAELAPVVNLELGHEYQNLYGWFRSLDLLRPARQVYKVSIEDPSALFFDDVTVHTARDARRPAEFIQVKFHIDQAGAYTAKSLTTTKSRNGRSLLEKAWDTWEALHGQFQAIELVLATTYAWHPEDPLAKHIWTRGQKPSTSFIDGSVVGEAAEARTAWWHHLDDPDPELFSAFLSTLRFRLGFSPTAELRTWTADIMELVGLKHEPEDVEAGVRQILNWLSEGRSEITVTEMTKAIDALDLRDPEALQDPAVSVFIHTIIKEPAETAADWELDWRGYFVEGEWVRGHRVHDPQSWNESMLPDLVRVRNEIMAMGSVRLVRVAGKARLSAWFAIGWTFPRVGNWTLEVDQGGQWWRNTAPAANDLEIKTELEERAGDKDTIAVGISLTGDLATDVRGCLERAGNPAGRLLLIQTSLGLGTTIRGPGDLVWLADQIKPEIRAAMGGSRPKRLLVFYFGPLAGAAFIGASLNAAAGEIQIFEDTDGSYEPSFTLR
jgi:hypothetical protein